MGEGGRNVKLFFWARQFVFQNQGGSGGHISSGGPGRARALPWFLGSQDVLTGQAHHEQGHQGQSQKGLRAGPEAKAGLGNQITVTQGGEGNDAEIQALCDLGFVLVKFLLAGESVRGNSGKAEIQSSPAHNTQQPGDQDSVGLFAVSKQDAGKAQLEQA